MAICRTIPYPSGGKLLIYPGGKKHYIPSQAYETKRQEYLANKQCRRNPETVTEDNCFKLLAAVFGYSLEKNKNPFKDQLKLSAQPKLQLWRD